VQICDLRRFLEYNFSSSKTDLFEIGHFQGEVIDPCMSRRRWAGEIKIDVYTYIGSIIRRPVCSF